MLHVFTADLEVDDDPIRTGLLRVDMEDGDLHIRQSHGDIGQHAHGIQGMDLEQGLVHTLGGFADSPLPEGALESGGEMEWNLSFF